MRGRVQPVWLTLYGPGPAGETITTAGPAYAKPTELWPSKVLSVASGQWPRIGRMRAAVERRPDDESTEKQRGHYEYDGITGTASLGAEL